MQVDEGVGNAVNAVAIGGDGDEGGNLVGDGGAVANGGGGVDGGNPGGGGGAVVAVPGFHGGGGAGGVAEAVNVMAAAVNGDPEATSLVVAAMNDDMAGNTAAGVLNGVGLFDAALAAALQPPPPGASNRRWAIHAASWYLVHFHPELSLYDYEEWLQHFNAEYPHLRE